ncbi:hypothetical protein DSO57_1018949 [Entomophthora muscae]|uniref:Uncharacterized protein n=1 Tax=Entomophthora muscae TaxID=34485 RepID=A0ACC2U292_9FUNG|nr:hypothetical protein DSO57_1018949 [Entomophthora muscae]
MWSPITLEQAAAARFKDFQELIDRISFQNLRRILDDPEDLFAEWDCEGLCIVIKCPEAYCYVKCSISALSYPDFTTKLELYGFTRILVPQPDGSSCVGYSHKHFTRDRPDDIDDLLLAAYRNLDEPSLHRYIQTIPGSTVTSGRMIKKYQS